MLIDKHAENSLRLKVSELEEEVWRLRSAIDAMRCAGGSQEFQAAFDAAKELVANAKLDAMHRKPDWGGAIVVHEDDSGVEIQVLRDGARLTESAVRGTVDMLLESLAKFKRISNN